MFHSAVSQSPRVALNTGWQATGKLEKNTHKKKKQADQNVISLSLNFNQVLASKWVVLWGYQPAPCTHDFNYLLNVCVLHEITGITECWQCIHRQVSIIAAKTLPTLRLINCDDLGAKQVQHNSNKHQLGVILIRNQYRQTVNRI